MNDDSRLVALDARMDEREQPLADSRRDVALSEPPDALNPPEA